MKLFKKAYEVFLKISKSLSRQNPWIIQLKEFTTSLSKRNTLTAIINGFC